MKWIYICFISIIQISLVRCTVFLWSDKEFEISPLQKFNDDNLALLLKKMDYPEVIAYSNPNQNLPLDFKTFVNGGFSAYNSNEELININTTELSGNVEADFSKIKEDIDNAKSHKLNVLFLIISSPSGRAKRQIDEEELSTPTPIKGPIAYIGKSKTDEKYGIIYSSSPLILRINKTDLELYETVDDLVSVDTKLVPGDTKSKEYITRLNVNIPQGGSGRKIVLRFIFNWVNYYWYLKSVRISDTYYNFPFNLTIDKEVWAPAGFSYHCSGSTAFLDPANDVYLYLTDMQVQIGSKKQSFGDAYDCIYFTTIPIWSGIFVSILLIVVLMLSLIALGDIKTMDKWDNSKTKQLTITVTE